MSVAAGRGGREQRSGLSLRCIVSPTYHTIEWCNRRGRTELSWVQARSVFPVSEPNVFDFRPGQARLLSDADFAANTSDFCKLSIGFEASDVR